MINFSTLQGLTIPEGNVTQIADASGRVLWSAVKLATITLKGDFAFSGVRYNGVYYGSGTTTPITFTANVGDVIFVESHGYTDSPIYLNGKMVANEPSETEYYYTVVSDAVIMATAGGEMYNSYSAVYITETPVTFTINGTEYSAYPSMTWTQWNDSEFNTSGQKVATVTDADGNSVSLDSLIVGGTAYEVGFDSGGPYTVVMKQLVLGLVQNVDGKIHFTLDGQTYKPSSDVSQGEAFATTIVPSGTVMHCYVDSSDAMMGNSVITVNGVTVENVNSALVEYDHTVNGNILVALLLTCSNPMIRSLKVYIADIPEGCIAFVVGVSNSAGAASNYNTLTTHYAKDGMTWGDWVNSEYNTEGYRIYNDRVLSPTSDYVEMFSTVSSPILRPNDPIIANAIYGYLDV